MTSSGKSRTKGEKKRKEKEGEDKSIQCSAPNTRNISDAHRSSDFNETKKKKERKMEE